MKNQAFTLIELLIVVLIIAILAAIAVPQYKIVVAKARFTSILPIMRRFSDAITEWKLSRGEYCIEWRDGVCRNRPNGNHLGVTWPSNFVLGDKVTPCGNNLFCNTYKGDKAEWQCQAREYDIWCHYTPLKLRFRVSLPDFPDARLRNKITCESNDASIAKQCKKFGGVFGYRRTDLDLDSSISGEILAYIYLLN